MDQETLLRLIDSGLSQRQIGEATGRSQSTVKWWLRKYGLKTTRRPWNQSDGFECRVCGETDPTRAKDAGHGRRSPSICSGCHDRRRVEQQRRLKLRAIRHKGGRCQRCGYDRCPAALQFHHRDPSVKDPDWSSFRSYRWARLVEEIEKCDLLCANCHAEVHWLELAPLPDGLLTAQIGRRGGKLGRPFRDEPLHAAGRENR